MLPVLAEHRTDELFASFVSRTARANGISGLEDLLLDLSVNPSDFHSGKVNAIKRVAEVVGVDTEDALRLSFRKVGKERFSISGQEFSDWYLKRSLYRVCPACIRQDIGPDLTSKTFTQPYARIVWAVTTAHSCPLHRLLLVNPPEPGPAHEFHQTWEPWLLEIFEGDLDSQTASEGAFEAFAAERLSDQNRSFGGPIANLPLEIVGSAAEVLGFSVLHGAKWLRKEMTPENKALAVDAGFKALQGGEAGVCAVLDRLRLAAGQPQDKPSGRYGALYEWLLRGGGSGPKYGFLQSQIERHIEENWALGPNDIGFTIEERTRRFHSILTASAQFELRPQQVGSPHS